MKVRLPICLLFIFLPLLLFAQAERSRRPRASTKITLNGGWALQSSGKAGVAGEAISLPAFQPKDWYAATVPSTVVAALVKDKVYPDPNFGINLQKIPGADHSGKVRNGLRTVTNLSDLPLETSSPFAVPWWYRRTFQLPASLAGKTIWLHFSGINYRANIWLNGKKIADEDEVSGTWRSFEFNITSIAHPGAENAIAVEVSEPTQNDLAVSFVDWNPIPPDRDMGLFREVYISTSGPVALRYPAVLSHLDLPAIDHAQLTVAARLENGTALPIEGVLRSRIGKLELSQQVALQPRETKDVTFNPDKFPQLRVAHPRLWWPAQMGQPNLYDLKMQFEVNGQVSDETETQFGIREITSEFNQDGARIFLVNGKRLLIRGAGWSMNMMLREDPQKMRDELRYASDMGLNTIRLEGMLETENFFDLADRQGVLVMAGWSCSLWEPWSKWKKEEYAERYANWMQHDFRIAEESQRSQILRLRGHPSLLMWENGSDNPPPPAVEEMYLGVARQYLWPNPILSSVSGQPTPVSWKTGLKETGPYEWVAPAYWLEDKKEGGAFGFSTETSPGPAVPPIESLRRMLPDDHLWPIDAWWNFHAGGGAFEDIHVFSDALNARYGKADNVEDFALKSQAMGYEGIRAMFEAYSRNKYTSTGVIQWMLNNAWPSMIWHLYDYYLRPGGGYFGAKTAMEPLHPLYSYDDQSIWVVSSRYKDTSGVKLTAAVYNMDMTRKFSRTETLNADADTTNRMFSLPKIDGLTPVYFLRLTLEDGTGKRIGSNFYWLSTKTETLDWKHSKWPATPTASYADYTALERLPKVKLKVHSRIERRGEEEVIHATVKNPSKNLAFFIRMKAIDANGEEILPVVWQDNYFSLLPGEEREVTAEYRRSERRGTSRPSILVTGWNVQG
jgi:exo-1,4-beta-D-glucosaminidase